MTLVRLVPKKNLPWEQVTFVHMWYNLIILENLKIRLHYQITDKSEIHCKINY